jgi:multidrug efflux pump subunit AcrA (membrane-fusion protein)
VNERAEVDRKIQVKAVASFVLILAIIVVTALGIVLLVINKRVAKEDEKRRIVPAVEIVEVAAADHAVKIFTQGVVESARETKLAAEVGGRMMGISPSFKRGGVVKKGERLVQIDPADYRSALAAAEVRRAEAELALEQEKARVEQAKLDWEKLGSGSKPLNPLVLREPYLAAAEASAASAVEAAAKARRDVERTEILAPFDAGVRSANAEVGAVVAPADLIGMLDPPPFAAPPAVCAPALAVVSEMTPELLSRSESLAAELRHQLDSVAGQFPAVLSGAAGTGTILELRLAEPRAAEFRSACRSRGLLVGAAGPASVSFTPALVAGPAELSHAADVLSDLCLEWVTA